MADPALTCTDRTASRINMTADPLNCDTIPTISFDNVAHVGTLNPADKGTHFGWSYEGNGLSISVNPDAWTAIARLGGTPTWTATRTGNQFVDRWELTATQCAAIEHWATTTGLCEQATRWEVHTTDEDGDDRSFYCTTHADALTEADDLHDNPADTITEVVVLAVTAAGHTRTGFPVGEAAGAFDAALIAWTEAHTHFDGVWWNDDYDPDALSAPRGTIFAARVADWSFTNPDTTGPGE